MASMVYLAAVGVALLAVTAEDVRRLIEMVRGARRRGSLVLICGNGGSAATASHFAIDLQKVGVRAVALTDAAMLTAWANDEGYESSFSGPATWVGARGDVLIALSVSGTSLNVVKALAEARVKGLATALLTSAQAPGEAVADVELRVVSDDYGVVEDCHLAICHAVTRSIVS